MKKAARSTALIASLAAFLEALVPLLPAQYHGVAHPAIAFLCTGIGFLMRSPLTPKLPTLDPLEDEPKNRSASTFPPIAGACLLVLLGGCGASMSPEFATVNDIVDDVQACTASAVAAQDPREALLACGSLTVGRLSTLCASGVFPRGKFCDLVGGAL